MMLIRTRDASHGLSWMMLNVALGFIMIVGIMPGFSWAQSDLHEKEQEAFKRAANRANASVVQMEVFSGLDPASGEQGSVATLTGTIVEDGWIISSLFHFRSASATTTVVMPNGERLAARLVAKDFARELALLKIDSRAELKPIVPSEASSWQVGQWVVALGKPFDPSMTSRSVGILSAQGRAFDRAIQIDAKVSPLNYGGPVIDLSGRTMAILTPVNPNIATEGEVQQWYDSGIAFAIPIQDVLSRLQRMKEGKDIYPGKIGIRPKSKDDFGGPIVLAGVAPSSPAAKAGLKSGDTIRKVQGRSVATMNELRHALGPYDAEQSVEVDFERDGMPKSTVCELVKEIPVYREPFLGFTLVATNADDNLEIDSVLSGFGAEKAGLKSGMMLESINGVKVENRNKLKETLAFLDYRDTIRLEVRNSKGSMVEFSIQPSYVSKELTSWEAKSSSAQAKEGKGLIDVPLADVPNKVFAYVPPNYTPDVPMGLMVVLPEAGKVERKPWIDAWDASCRDLGWIMVFITSADPKQWSREETELIPRLIRQFQKDYTIDTRRVVVGGLGTGGTIALVGALQQKTTIRGLWMVDSRVPNPGRLPAAEPMESTQWLLVGSRKEYPKFADLISKLGFPIQVVSQPVELEKLNHASYMPAMQKWLKRMEAY